MSVYCCSFRYRLSPETFGYTLIRDQIHATAALFPVTEGWVYPRNGLDVVAKRKIPVLPEIEPRP
jgi:hypothetical protein